MSTALYRRYRPETFADVIGQEHVTEPLMAALVADRITHAYLFSGPRGCGKTTSARILARCLNCAEGPTASPCGSCDSCTDLARGGPGSLDVVEIDAASHNGVDDARELRERAAFAPARDRFKIFILDEAHMVTTQGFNALLKLVEEPPSHVKFVFATTEPDKVIGTIRSRTHHYPFRLVPPEQLLAYLEQLARAEGTSIDGGVLPLVVRAGGGSVRDSLSVLDQLIAGADGGQVTYERAVALLGFTHGALLDDAVEALAARDGGSLFRVVDRVIDSGHAPRRFVEDLLERLRDLIVVRAAGESAGAVLRTVPADQLERMHNQAQHLGAGALSRAADLVNEGLTEMTGATSPRLQLELLCARLLLPAADDGVEGFHARLDRLEGAVASRGVPALGQGFPPAAKPGGGQPPAGAVPDASSPGAGATPRSAPPDPGGSGAPTGEPTAGSDAAAQATAAEVGGSGQARVRDRDASAEAPIGPATPTPSSAPSSRDAPASSSAPPASTAPAVPQASSSTQEAAAPGGDDERGASPTGGARVPAAEVDQGRAVTGGAPSSSKPSAAGLTSDQVRRRWPEVLETLAQLKRTTWALISQDAQVVDLSPTTLSIGFSTSGLATAFRKGPHGDVLAQALRETLGLEVKVEPVLSSDQPAGSGPGASASAESGGSVPTQEMPRQRPAAAEEGVDAAPDGGPDSASRGEPASGADAAPASADASSRGADARSDARGQNTSPAGSATGAGPPSNTSGWADVAVRRPPQPEDSRPDVVPENTQTSANPPATEAAAASPQDTVRVEGAGRTPEPAASGGVSSTPVPDAPDSAPTRAAPDSTPNRTAPDPAPAPPPWDEDIPPAEPPEDPYGSHPSPASSGTQTAAAPPAAISSETTRDEPPRSSPRPWERDLPAEIPPSSSKDEEDHPDPDDPDLDTTDVVGAPLVARLLGGTVIDEIVDDEGEKR